jgi:hypothetical protein
MRADERFCPLDKVIEFGRHIVYKARACSA